MTKVSYGSYYHHGRTYIILVTKTGHVIMRTRRHEINTSLQKRVTEKRYCKQVDKRFDELANAWIALHEMQKPTKQEEKKSSLELTRHNTLISDTTYTCNLTQTTSTPIAQDQKERTIVQ